MAAAVAQAVATYGRLDVVVSNAGVASRGRTVADTPHDELERLLASRRLAGVDDPGVPGVFGPPSSPDDVARVVRFLVGPEGRQVSGQRIVVDGGGLPG